MKLLSAFNPSRLAPVEHTHAHAQGHTLIETDAIYTGAVSSPGMSLAQPWQGGGPTPLQLSVSPIFEGREWE